MSSLLCLDLFSILSASTLSSIITCMLTIISKRKWSSRLKITVSVGACGPHILHTLARAYMHEYNTWTTYRGHTHTHTHTHIHNYSDFLVVTISVGHTQARTHIHRRNFAVTSRIFCLIRRTD